MNATFYLPAQGAAKIFLTLIIAHAVEGGKINLVIKLEGVFFFIMVEQESSQAIILML